jgi:hypothetical protein
MIILLPMCKKSLRVRSLGIIILIFAALLSFIILRKDYLLNKTIREVALRMVQLEVLSRTRAVDYKVVFERGHYFIQVFDSDKKEWLPYLKASYRGRVLNRQSKFEFIFSRGSLREYRVRDKGRKLPRYVVVEFFLPGSSKKKSLIFYKKGDWKVLG